MTKKRTVEHGVWSRWGLEKVIDRYSLIDYLNSVHVRACCKLRHARCVKRNACGIEEPRCEWDKLKLVGKSIGGELTRDDRMVKIPKILARCLRGCQKYTLTLTEEKK